MSNIKEIIEKGNAKFTVKGITEYRRGGEDNEYGDFPKILRVSKDSDAVFEDHGLFGRGMNVTKLGPTCITLYTFDMLGKKIIETNPNNVKSILNLSSLENGIYIVKVSFEKTVETFRVLKN